MSMDANLDSGLVKTRVTTREPPISVSAEHKRLRKIETAARELVDRWRSCGNEFPVRARYFNRLKAALDAKAEP